jgi:hypothetical protein
MFYYLSARPCKKENDDYVCDDYLNLATFSIFTIYDDLKIATMRAQRLRSMLEDFPDEIDLKGRYIWWQIRQNGPTGKVVAGGYV